SFIPIDERWLPEATHGHIEIAVVVQIRERDPMRNVCGTESPRSPNFLEGPISAVAKEHIWCDQRRIFPQLPASLQGRSMQSVVGRLLKNIEVLCVIGGAIGY